MYIFLHTTPKFVLKNILGMSRRILTSCCCCFNVPNVHQQIGEDEIACVHKPNEQGIMPLKPDHNSGYLLTPGCQSRSAILDDLDRSAPQSDFDKSPAPQNDLDISPTPQNDLDISPAPQSDLDRSPAQLLLDCSNSTHPEEQKQHDCGACLSPDIDSGRYVGPQMFRGCSFEDLKAIRDEIREISMSQKETARTQAEVLCSQREIAESQRQIAREWATKSKAFEEEIQSRDSEIDSLYSRISVYESGGSSQTELPKTDKCSPKRTRSGKNF